jgi:hypothetical protein
MNLSRRSRNQTGHFGCQVSAVLFPDIGSSGSGSCSYATLSTRRHFHQLITIAKLTQAAIGGHLQVLDVLDARTK